MRGRKPKPVALKVLAGNPGKRPIKAQTVRPVPRAPYCPRWLSPAAKDEWRRVVPELDKLGLLTEIDVAALAAYCQAYARWREAEAILEREGIVVEHTNKAGATNVVTHPAFFIAQKYAQQMRAFAAEFGMTPSSRARLSLPEVEDDADDFFTTPAATKR